MGVRGRSGYERPFLKYAGSKYGQMERLVRKLPKAPRLVEPFVGSGAVFMGTDYEAYTLADRNGDVIDLYALLRDEGEAFIAYARSFFTRRNNSPEAYYLLRDRFNVVSAEQAPAFEWERAALFVYLNRHGFNGLCRYNRSGEFNVPFGQYARPYFPERELRAFYRKLREREVELLEWDFRESMPLAWPDAVVYCDPPFVELSKSASFTAYSGDRFTWSDQVALIALARELQAAGVPVVVSNHSDRRLNGLYREAGASLAFRRIARTISCKGSGRKPVTEVLAYWEAA